MTSWLRGVGLHTGLPCAARWVAREGALRVRRTDGAPSEVVVSLERALETPRASRVALPDGRSVLTVEHALSAVTARGCFEGVTLEVAGPELPLLDGAARLWAEALGALAPEARGPRWEIPRAARFTVGESALELSPGEPTVRAWTDLRGHGLATREVSWEGTWEAYLASLARSRTFGFASELGYFRARGLGQGLDPRAVVVFEEGRAHPAFAAPTDPGEPYRHKLLDVLGDLGLLGGRVLGALRFERPGHARTLALLRQAVREGALRQR
ncbi:MAG: UDP-3-O-acyl-N-acetylglucosamine deacetylase [Deltaproteobacteria bacterium]|nr:UDP-3-O-acyl-N-acetylglucosamine deacetylase [Deltaproteobacteria bacterium]